MTDFTDSGFWIKDLLPLIVAGFALFLSIRANKFSKKSAKAAERSAVAAEKSADESEKARKIAQSELNLPHIVEIKKFFGALERAGEIKVSDLNKIETSLSHLTHMPNFSFLKSMIPIVDHYCSIFRYNQPRDIIKLGNSKLDSQEGLKKIGFQNIVLELSKIDQHY